MQFAIHFDNLERLHKKMDRIRTKCEKYGCDFVYKEIGEEFRNVKDENGYVHAERFVIVECEGTAKIHGWRFVATVDHTEKGNIIRKMTDDVEVPERYRTSEPICEHCNSRRHRKDTYIVYNEKTGEFKQVGSTCLCDFTGGLSAEVAASYISLFDSLIEFEAPMTGVSHKTYYSTKDVLKYAVDYVENLGYSSTTYPDGDYNPNSTKVKVIEALLYQEGRADKSQQKSVEKYRDKFGEHFDDKYVSKRVDDILQFCRDSEDDSDYMMNLSIIADLEYIEYRSIGYAVSMVPCYNKHVEYLQRKAEAERLFKEAGERSDYLGVKGDRIGVDVKDVKVITHWDNQFGVTIRYQINDYDGNVLMWDSSTGIDPDRKVKQIIGTVKKLDEFRGVKQTWITRCRVEYEEGEEK